MSDMLYLLQQLGILNLIQTAISAVVVIVILLAVFRRL